MFYTTTSVLFLLKKNTYYYFWYFIFLFCSCFGVQNNLESFDLVVFHVSVTCVCILILQQKEKKYAGGSKNVATDWDMIMVFIILQQLISKMISQKYLKEQQINDCPVLPRVQVCRLNSDAKWRVLFHCFVDTIQETIFKTELLGAANVMDTHFLKSDTRVRSQTTSCGLRRSSKQTEWLVSFEGRCLGLQTSLALKVQREI